MNAKIDWNEATAAADSASVGEKLLNTVVPTYNELLDLRATYKAATDVDGAVEALIDSADPDSEIGKMSKQIKQAEALIASHTAKIQELARVEALKNTAGEDFDEEKAKANYNDSRRELVKATQGILTTFELLGWVSPTKSETGRVTGYTVTDDPANKEYAELLMQVLDVPKLDGKASGGTDNKAAEIRKWALDTGLITSTKGKLSHDVKKAYFEAHKNEAPENVEESESE